MDIVPRVVSLITCSSLQREANSSSLVCSLSVRSKEVNGQQRKPQFNKPMECSKVFIRATKFTALVVWHLTEGQLGFIFKFERQLYNININSLWSLHFNVTEFNLARLKNWVLAIKRFLYWGSTVTKRWIITGLRTKDFSVSLHDQ